MRPLNIVLLSMMLPVSLIACQSSLRNVSLTNPGAASQSDELDEAVERYFLALTPEEMREAVEIAKATGPLNGDYHFIAADLAMFDDRRNDRFDHLVETVRDSGSQFANPAIRQLWYLPWTFEQEQIAAALYENVAKDHPDHRMRAFAAYALANRLNSLGELSAAKKMTETIAWPLPFTVIGTWNNEQGKGFDMSFPPEEKIDLTKKYVGQFVETRWRSDPLRTPTNEIDFTQLFYPQSWAIGYAVVAFEAIEKAELELRLSTSDALKVWVNDKLLFSERKIQSPSFETIVIPITVNKGVNRILVKLSQDGDSTWNFFGRLTGTGGTPIEDGSLKAVKADTPIARVDDDPADPKDALAVIESNVEEQHKSPVVGAFMRASWTDTLGLATIPVKAAEAFVDAARNSFRAKYALAIALWNNQERAKASLVLSELGKKHKTEFVEIALKQARFWNQSQLEKKARELLLEVVEQRPKSPGAKFALAEWYGNQGWQEDRLFILEEIYEDWPNHPSAILELADCYEDLDFDHKFIALHERILDEYPYEWSSLMVKYEYAKSALDFKEAESVIVKLLEAWPSDISLLAKLAEMKRRQEKFEDAKKILSQIRKHIPDSPWTYNRLAHFAYFQKQTDAAVKLWKGGLARDPNDGDLEERLSYLVPLQPEQWRKDVPTKEQILNAVNSRNDIKPHPGANTILILDNDVTKLNTDGSSIGMITSVLHSLNIDGRDAITTHRIGCRGRTKVLLAYSVSPDGQMTEASSIDGNTIKFRGLEVGSTIAAQSRCERQPDKLIGNHFSAEWSFQGFRVQFIDSRYTLWAPPKKDIKEFVRGDIKREESMVGDLKRISWSATNPPVVMPEPRMPPLGDVAWRLQLSTVPSWNEFFKWEEALLIDAFRESPEIIALADRLFKGGESKKENLRKIQAYLAEHIRYKQEYENSIAGVKPHPSPMVLSRGYGDCKDKSVFFITLAKLADIEARFAIVRTRGAGQIRKATPSQQFNHAIVYIPAQEGIDGARFYDPTADGLDVDIIRFDVPGTEAMVADLEQSTYEWVKIPYNPPEEVYFNQNVDLILQSDGGAKGSINIETQGYSAAQVRLISRNKERFEKVLQHLANEVLPGAALDNMAEVEIQDVNRPVQFVINAKTATFARADGKELSFKIPYTDIFSKNFVIDERSYPLILGVPSKSKWTIKFNLPKGSKIKKTPKSYKMTTDCVVYERTLKSRGNSITVEQRTELLCERVPVEQYPTYRTEIQKLRQVFEDDIIIRVK